MTNDPANIIADTRVIGIVREPSAKAAFHQACRLAANKVRAIEVSLATPGAMRVISRMRTELAGTDVCCGVGTVLDGEQLRQAADAGAQFAVSPIATDELGRRARELGIVSVFGAASPTECYRAVARGSEFVKLFPARLWSPAGVRDLLQALPTLRLVPTGGVSLDGAAEWLKAGAAAVGLGGALRAEKSDERMATVLAGLARGA